VAGDSCCLFSYTKIIIGWLLLLSERRRNEEEEQRTNIILLAAFLAAFSCSFVFLLVSRVAGCSHQLQKKVFFLPLDW
jgi:hypothetical protein